MSWSIIRKHTSRNILRKRGEKPQADPPNRPRDRVVEPKVGDREIERSKRTKPSTWRLVSSFARVVAMMPEAKVILNIFFFSLSSMIMV
jgi:hypothetical protein